MATADIERRLTALETEVAELRNRLSKPKDQEKWWQKISGAFAGDPAFLEAMRLGREYRESLRPKPRKTTRKKPRATRAGHRSRKPA